MNYNLLAQGESSRYPNKSISAEKMLGIRITDYIFTAYSINEKD